MISEPYNPTLHTQADLEEAWRHLISPLGFSSPSLWWMPILPDGNPVRQLVEIADLGPLPRPDDLDELATAIVTMTDDLWSDPGAQPRIAFLLTRPGRDGTRTRDRVWAAGLHAAMHRAGLPCETVHLATDVDLVPVPVDAFGVA